MSSPRYRRRRVAGAERRTFWDHNERGLLFYSRGRYGRAIAELERAVAASVFPPAALYVNLGAAYLRDGRFGEARDSLEEGLHTNPDDQTGHVLLGHALLALGESGAARTEFERAWELNPDSPEGGAAEEELRHLHGVLLR
jgi:Flp pilus assembly protein TadD